MTDGVLPAADRIERFTGELVAYVRSLYPMRFYGGEAWANLYTSAALLRLADMAEAVLVHMPQRRDLDAAASLRSMYELVVTVCWVFAAPEERKELWEGEALIQQLKLHNDLAAFGERLLDEREIQAGSSARGMPPLTERARQADEYWSDRVDGLHPGDHLLSFRGLSLCIAWAVRRRMARSRACFRTSSSNSDASRSACARRVRAWWCTRWSPRFFPSRWWSLARGFVPSTSTGYARSTMAPPSVGVCDERVLRLHRQRARPEVAQRHKSHEPRSLDGSRVPALSQGSAHPTGTSNGTGWPGATA